MASNPDTTTRQHTLPPGTEIDRFRIESVLGTGAFGITYGARDVQLERLVAIKEYFPKQAARREEGGTMVYATEGDVEGLFDYGLERFLDEARTLARFRHPNIVGVQQYLEANGTALLVMDFEEGMPLSTRIKRKGRLSETELLALVKPILEGLEAIHEQGVLHRDIKPANLLLREDGTPVLLDFGAARQVSPDKHMTIVLTPKYAPVEQYATESALGPWTDLYALGATAFHALTGRAPMLATERLIANDGGDTVPRQLRALTGQVSPVTLNTLHAMLRPDPDDRPRNARETIDMLEGRTLAPSLPRPADPATEPPHEEFPATIATAATSPSASKSTSTGPSPSTRTLAKAVVPPRGSRLPWVVGVMASAALTAAALYVLLPTGGEPDIPIAPTASSQPPQIESPTGERSAPMRITDTLASGHAAPSMVVIPTGSFMRGSPPQEPGRDSDEGPISEVTFSAPFAVGETEVTVAQFRDFVEATSYVTEAERDAHVGCRTWDGEWDWRSGVNWRSPGYPQSDAHPAVCISWNDAQEYARWLSRETGYTYDLPSESMWEYATRAGNTDSHYWGSNLACRFANVSDLSRARATGLSTHPNNVFMCEDGSVHAAAVGSYEPNEFGLSDTLGNVWEWTADCWGTDYFSAPRDGSAVDATDCNRRTYRGGSWVNVPRLVRSASRGADDPSVRFFNTGFRVSRALRLGDPGFTG